MTKKTNKPTDSELEILQLLWKLKAASVREINDALNRDREGKEVGYTTTLKLMQIMLEKGLLNRNSDSRTHIYSAAVDEESTQKKLLDKFLDATFRGSKMKLVMQAMGNSKASEKELDELKALIKKIEERK